MANDKKWIANAIKNPGSLTKKAEDAGMSISEYCAQDGLDSSTKKQCVLAKTLKRFSKK